MAEDRQALMDDDFDEEALGGLPSISTTITP